ncbi:MAG: hypothetical protein QOF51_1090 [Chloroflexota bacterium]|jgi:enamine deaminase RidA (YjgF/YER057c/UK114 family)|nr:hypothetical protein [Chloroflexota bacterium]
MRKSFPLVVNGQRATYAKGVVADGRYIFLSGVLSTEGSMGDQATRVWDEIRARLADLGGKPENIVQRMTFVTDLLAWRAEGAPRQIEWLQKNAPALLEDQPSSTLVQIVALAQQGAMVEIQVIAVVE